MRSSASTPASAPSSEAAAGPPKMTAQNVARVRQPWGGMFVTQMTEIRRWFTPTPCDWGGSMESLSPRTARSLSSVGVPVACICRRCAARDLPSCRSPTSTSHVAHQLAEPTGHTRGLVYDPNRAGSVVDRLRGVALFRCATSAPRGAGAALKECCRETDLSAPTHAPTPDRLVMWHVVPQGRGNSCSARSYDEHSDRAHLQGCRTELQKRNKRLRRRDHGMQIAAPMDR